MRKTVLAMTLIAALGLTGCPSPFTLGFPGELTSRRLLVDDPPGIHPIAIYFPESDVPLGEMPLVIIDTGWNQPRLSYDGYGQQLAQWGFVCVVKFVASAGLTGLGESNVDDHLVQNIDLIDYMEGLNQDPDSALFGLVDTENVGIAGHSLGSGIALDTALAEDRIKACVCMDGNFPGPEYDPRAELPLTDDAILFFYATEGRWCSGQRFEAPRLFEYTVPDAIEVSITGASHIDFMDSIIGLTHVAPYVCPRGSAEPQDVRDITTRYMIAWFTYYLKGDASLEGYFNGPESQADEAAGIVSIRYNLEAAE